MSKPLAVLSGGTGYIGGAIKREFEKRGWHVADLSRSSGEFPCDIAKKDEVARAIESIVEKYGEISACVHAAHPNDDGLESMDVSLKVARGGAENLSSAATPHLKSSGAFIGITTQLIEEGVRSPESGAYIESKKALRAFLRELSRSSPFRVYAVAPGYLPGGLNKDVPRAVIEMLARKTSATEQSVEKVADIVVRAAEGAVEFPPGSSILVDGEVVSPL